MHGVAEMALKNSLSLGLWITEGLIDKSNWIPGVSSSRIGLILFERWFVERKLFVSYANVWNFDRGKPVIPSVSMGCDQVTKVVRGVENEVDDIKTLSTHTNFSKEIIKVAHFNIRVAEKCRTMCRVFGEGEEDFIPMVFMQTVPLTFC